MGDIDSDHRYVCPQVFRSDYWGDGVVCLKFDDQIDMFAYKILGIAESGFGVVTIVNRQ